MTDKKLTQTQKEIVSAYLKLAKKNSVHPTRSDMLNFGVSRDRIRNAFGSLEELKKFVVVKHPDIFKGIIDASLFTSDSLKELDEELKKYKRFFITTAVGGGKVLKSFYDNIKVFCSYKKAKLLILMCEDPASIRKFTIPKGLEYEQFIFSDVALNSNLFISTIKLSAKHIDPVTGLARLGKRTGSFIFASPKQRLMYSPVRNNKIPHALITPGSVTLPDYQTDRYMSERTAALAKNDHVMGGIVVEIVDNTYFHFRQVQAEKNGSFVDLGVYVKNGEIDA
jgi:hypothetical protein